MSTAQLVGLDLVVAVAAAAGWLGAGAAAAGRRARMALALLAGAVAVTLARVGTTTGLAGRGWWFAQEKVTLTVPLLGIAGLAATLLAGPRLVAAARRGRHDSAAGGPRIVVPLLTAGYAAVAGVMSTLLLGYPATYSRALATLALVGAAALVTWRVATPAASRPNRPATATLVAVALTALAGAGLAVRPADHVDAGGGPAGGHDAGHGVPVTDLRGPTAPDPGGTVRRFTLTARKATVTLSSGRQVAAWTYNGQVPGPAITATEGDLIQVTLRNADIRRGVTVHWHGYDVPNGDDGAPGLTQQAVAPGQEFVYRFVADQVGSYWYHTHQVSDEGVRMGLYGALVVTPRGGTPPGLDLVVPVHTLAGTLVFGDHDRPDIHRVPPGTPVRLRLVNTDSTPHRFTLGGTAYRLVAVDGTDLHQPGELAAHGLRLPAGGRFDVAFRMPAGPVALLVDGDRAGGLRFAPEGTEPGLVEDASGWPDLDLTRYGTPAPTPFAADSPYDRRFTLVLDRGVALVDGRPEYAHTVNGRAFPSTPTQLVGYGDLVRMTVINRGPDTHPWHLHGDRVLVLTRDGRPPSGSPLWLDTFDVRPGEVWQVGFRATNPGQWMNHCHNLSHAAAGMAVHLAYDGVSTPFSGAHGG